MMFTAKFKTVIPRPKIDPMKTIRKKLCISLAGLMLLLAPQAVTADVVIDWNAIMQSKVATPATNVFFQTRNAAITQLAVFEAVNAIIGDYEPYLGMIPLHPVHPRRPLRWPPLTAS